VIWRKKGDPTPTLPLEVMTRAPGGYWDPSGYEMTRSFQPSRTAIVWDREITCFGDIEVENSM
jgi:hypothetical protein